MNWNPFARPKEKAAPPVDAEPEHVVTQAMRAMLAQQSVQADTRPLQRAILGSEFLVPLHEPPQEIGGRTRLRYLTFRDDMMVAVFTTPDRMRAFLTGFPEIGARVAITYLDGQAVCRMAAGAGLQTLAIDIGSPMSYEMQPAVFQTLASGRILAAFPQVPARGVIEPQGETEIGAAPEGISDGTRAVFRQVLEAAGVHRAFLYGATMLEATPPELWISVAVEGASEDAMPELSRRMLAAWIDHWPFNTPLRLTRLDPDRPDADPRADELIAALGERIL